MNDRRRNDRLRQTLAREAARIMYEERVKQYIDAKHIAARRVLGRHDSRAMRYRPHDLPSNLEIREALIELASLVEGHERQDRLFAMRFVALEVMEALTPFHPALIGSVSTGAVRRGSDVDLHVFSDDAERVEQHLFDLGWFFDTSVVSIWKDNAPREFIHIHLQRTFDVELSVYPVSDRRVTGRSSTDGKPIVRLKPAALRALIAQEHPSAWQRFLDTGEGPDLARFEGDDAPLTLADVEAMVDELDGVEPQSPEVMVS